MTHAARERCSAGPSVPVVEERTTWKKAVARTFLDLQLIPEKFSGELVVSFKDGGVSYLKKSETFK